jgi:hypothetical protein
MIEHSATITFSFIERLKILFGKKLRTTNLLTFKNEGEGTNLKLVMADRLFRLVDENESHDNIVRGDHDWIYERNSCWRKADAGNGWVVDGRKERDVKVKWETRCYKDNCNTKESKEIWHVDRTDYYKAGVEPADDWIAKDEKPDVKYNVTND